MEVKSLHKTSKEKIRNLKYQELLQFWVSKFLSTSSLTTVKENIHCCTC